MKEYASVKPANLPNIESKIITDKENNHYQLLDWGWQDGKYIFTADRAYGVQLIDTQTDSVIQTYFRHPKFKKLDKLNSKSLTYLPPMNIVSDNRRSNIGLISAFND